MTAYHQDTVPAPDGADNEDDATLEARARALDPGDFRARLAVSGWEPREGHCWLHPATSTKVALPLHLRPEDSHMAAVTAAAAKGRGLESFVIGVERAHMDRYVFMPMAARAPRPSSRPWPRPQHWPTPSTSWWEPPHATAPASTPEASPRPWSWPSRYS